MNTSVYIYIRQFLGMHETYDYCLIGCLMFDFQKQVHNYIK